MTMRIIKFAIFGNCAQPDHRLDAIEQFFNFLSSLPEVDCVVEQGFKDYLLSLSVNVASFDTFEAIPQDATMALSLGGDGTFLETARFIGPLGTPILGINTGHLGFLADADIADAECVVSKIALGEYHIEPRSVLKVTVINDEQETDSDMFALNEVAMLRHDSASMIEVHTCIDSRPLADYRGDGLIVATPTGSTGYNLSVGGPIIEPLAPALSIAPIAPHSLSMRPLVVSDNTVIDITVSSRVPSWRLSLDGRWLTLPLTSGVRVTRGDFTVNIVHTPGHTFASTLRAKLLWGASTI